MDKTNFALQCTTLCASFANWLWIRLLWIMMIETAHIFFKCHLIANHRGSHNSNGCLAEYVNDLSYNVFQFPLSYSRKLFWQDEEDLKWIMMSCSREEEVPYYVLPPICFFGIKYDLTQLHGQITQEIDWNFQCQQHFLIRQ